MVGRRADRYFVDGWDGVFVMTPYDRWLEPNDDGLEEMDDGLTDAERRQKAFDDFDPDDNDFGDPL